MALSSFVCQAVCELVMANARLAFKSYVYSQCVNHLVWQIEEREEKSNAEVEGNETKSDFEWKLRYFSLWSGDDDTSWNVIFFFFF